MAKAGRRALPGNEIHWSGDLTIRRIAELKGEVLEALRHGDVLICIDAEAQFDLSFLQLLCAAHRTAQREGKSLQLHPDLPASFGELLKSAGFFRHVGCSEDKDDSCIWKTICLSPPRQGAGTTEGEMGR